MVKISGILVVLIAFVGSGCNVTGLIPSLGFQFPPLPMQRWAG